MRIFEVPISGLEIAEEFATNMAGGCPLQHVFDSEMPSGIVAVSGSVPTQLASEQASFIL